MDSPNKDLLARMPLAESVMLLWKWVTSPERLEAIWEEHRGRCYEKQISFDVMVHLIADALIKHDGSGRKAFELGIENEELGASLQAAYQKLGRLPIEVSQAFLTKCSSALSEAYPLWAEYRLPKSLKKFRVLVVDGKAIKRAAKRLKPLRGLSGGLLGGRALTAFDWCNGLVCGLIATEDGEANDKRFTGELVQQVRVVKSEPLVWIGDSAFCDLTQPAHFASRKGDHFLVRYHPGIPFHLDEKKATVRGIDELGRNYTQSWGWLGSPKNNRRIYVRRIEVARDGQKPLILITDLLDSDQCPAIDLLYLYRERWSIELVFQQVTDVFGLKHLIGGTPKASVFQLAFCMVIYNMLQVVRGYIAKGNDVEPQDVSVEKVFQDVEEQLIAWNIVIDLDVTTEYFSQLSTLSQLQKRLDKLLGNAWRERWRKAPPQTREPVEQETKRTVGRSGHNSVYRILIDHAKKSKKTKTKAP